MPGLIPQGLVPQDDPILAAECVGAIANGIEVEGVVRNGGWIV